MPPAAASSDPKIIVVGPPANGIGGMASVVGQILDIDFAGYYRIEPLPNTQARNARESLGCRIVRHIRQMRRLHAAIRRTKAPIVHLHTCSGFSFYRSMVDMLIAGRLGCRVILHIHGAKFDDFHAGEPTWRRRLIGWSLTRADRVVALSTRWRDKLREMAPDARLVVIENAVDLPPVTPKPQPNGPCRFVLLARMDEWKGIDDLLDACAHLHHDGCAVRVSLAGPPGTAGDAGALDKKIRSRNLEHLVRYVGEVRGEAKANLLVAADAYVQPSHHEGMPIALLEALAYGLPVVATRVGAVTEVITDQRQGLLVPPRRPDLLARAMRQIATDARRRVVMSKAARTLVSERFSLARFRRDLISLYDSLAASSSHTAAIAQRSCDNRQSQAVPAL